MGTAIAKGLNLAPPDMMISMMSGLDNDVAVAIANGLNANTALISSLLPELNGATGQAIAAGLNENSTKIWGGGEYFLEAMLKATSTGTAQAIVNAINTPPYNFDSFMNQLLRNLNGSAATAMAQAVSGNPTLVEYLLRNPGRGGPGGYLERQRGLYHQPDGSA